MNERIKELVKQTDEWFDEDGHSYSRPVWNEKFAELIVKECANTVDSLELSIGPFVMAVIKEHFGVE